MTAQIQALVYSAIEEVNPQLPDGMALSQSPVQPLFGGQGKLDSLGLVTVILAVEQKIRESMNIAISLVDERAVSRTQSPFRDIQSLVQYIEEVVSADPK